MKTFKTLLTATLSAAAISAVAWADTPAPSQVVYLPQLPTATELTQTAAAQGQTVSRIEQSNGQVTAVYSNGTVISYQLLPTQGQVQAGAPAPGRAPEAYAQPQAVIAQPATPAPVVTETAPASTVVYGPDYAAYPYDYYPYYGYGYYGPWYPGIRVGFGWGYGYRGGWAHPGYYHGGYRGGAVRGSSGGHGGHR